MKYIKSPLNYVGGKYKLLPDIIPLFPENINIFVDLFAGGFNVGINVDAKKIFCNDINKYIIELYSYFSLHSPEELVKEIETYIKEYDLTIDNSEGFLEFRKNYNQNPSPGKLFTLACFSFNHIIRFNSKHQFNTPFGNNRSQFNPRIKSNLEQFVNKLRNNNVEFLTTNFSDFDFSKLDVNSFVYCDPPYLISTGNYNDGKRGFKGWNENDDKQLMETLDFLNSKDVKFAMSNVFYHKGLCNQELIDWCSKKNYTVNYLNKEYSNCNYNLKDRGLKTVEVLITNY